MGDHRDTSATWFGPLRRSAETVEITASAPSIALRTVCECRWADQGCRPAGEGGELVIAAQSLGEDVTSGAAGGAEDRDPHRSLPLGVDGSVEARARFRVRPSRAPTRPRMATPSGTWTATWPLWPIAFWTMMASSSASP